MTIRECILKVLSNKKKLSAKEITSIIEEDELYSFTNAEHPQSVVGSELSKMLKAEFLKAQQDSRPYYYHI